MAVWDSFINGSVKEFGPLIKKKRRKKFINFSRDFKIILLSDSKLLMFFHYY